MTETEYLALWINTGRVRLDMLTLIECGKLDMTASEALNFELGLWSGIRDGGITVTMLLNDKMAGQLRQLILRLTPWYRRWWVRLYWRLDDWRRSR